MSDCIFCKIVSGEIPSYKIYEDDKFLAFLDIYPAVKGYILVIPKKHYRWVWDVEDIGAYFEVCKKIVKNLQKVNSNDSVYSMIIGEEVPHAHVRLIPGNDGGFNQKLFKFLDETQPKEMLGREEADELTKKLKINN